MLTVRVMLFVASLFLHHGVGFSSTPGKRGIWRVESRAPGVMVGRGVRKGGGKVTHPSWEKWEERQGRRESSRRMPQGSWARQICLPVSRALGNWRPLGPPGKGKTSRAQQQSKLLIACSAGGPALAFALR